MQAVWRVETGVRAAAEKLCGGQISVRLGSTLWDRLKAAAACRRVRETEIARAALERELSGLTQGMEWAREVIAVAETVEAMGARSRLLVLASRMVQAASAASLVLGVCCLLCADNRLAVRPARPLSGARVAGVRVLAGRGVEG